jgi:hypothetical protein
MTQTYVYKGVEVYLTGRTAHKRGRTGDKLLHETRPFKFINMKTDPNVEVYWVEMKELFEIDDTTKREGQ